MDEIVLRGLTKVADAQRKTMGMEDLFRALFRSNAKLQRISSLKDAPPDVKEVVSRSVEGYNSEIVHRLERMFWNELSLVTRASRDWDLKFVAANAGEQGQKSLE